MTTTRLPQLEGERLITDGGLETSLIFHDGLDLPAFAAFDVLKDDARTVLLRRYYDQYAAIAGRYGVGLLLESPTWRASSGWADATGYTPAEIDAVNRQAVELMQEIARTHADRVSPIVISGCVGPEGDGYSPETMLSSDDAEQYHSRQIVILADCGVDVVSALTMTYAEEAVGITRAARSAGVPVAISFTVETDGSLPSGQSLADAIAQVDAEAAGGPDYFMVNCAHPSHFAGVLTPDAPWLDRIRGIRANASRMSHAELDEATELDDGDPVELAAEYAALSEVLSGLTVLGGCCGTDHRHVAEIAARWTQPA